MADGEAPGFEARRDGDRLVLRGALDTETASRSWGQVLREAAGARVIDLAALQRLDTTGAALVMEASRGRGPLASTGHGAGGASTVATPPPSAARTPAAKDSPGQATIEGASPAVAAVLERVRDALARPVPSAQGRRLPLLAQLGAWGVGRWRAAGGGTAFLGEAAAVLLAAVLRPWRIGWGEVMRHLDEVGTRSFPLVAMLGVLIGLILAFQSSVPLRVYGGESFIPMLVGISLLRELGPLLAGVILAGRTGSAFAAEIGTMTVNEEIDALRIMGIDPMRMLVLPRLLAATVAMPVMTLLMDLSGLLGMAGVMASLGYPPVFVVHSLIDGVGMSDLLQGLCKSAVFGLVIAGIGARAGLGAGGGPRAVGDAATEAVVGGIVAIVLLDGLFAVLFYRLGI